MTKYGIHVMGNISTYMPQVSMINVSGQVAHQDTHVLGF